MAKNNKYAMKLHMLGDPRINVTKKFVEKHGFAINIDVARDLCEDRDDVWGFAAEVAVDFLTYEQAKFRLAASYKEHIKEGKEEWHQITDVMEAVQDFLDYMVFAWMKARDERGLSATRSIYKLAAWMKILGRPDIAKVLLDDDLYAPYGIPALVEACNMLGIKYPENLVYKKLI